jgi:hypothetical protein
MVQAFAALTDRIEGKVTNKVEMGGPGGGAIPVVSYSSPEENETAVAALLARHGLTWHRTVTVTFRLEDVKKSILKFAVNSA